MLNISQVADVSVYILWKMFYTVLVAFLLLYMGTSYDFKFKCFN